MDGAGACCRPVGHRFWQENKLAPYRSGRVRLSSDAAFVAKLEAVVGRPVDPRQHAFVLSIDEKSPIRALDRTQPGLPTRRGRPATMTPDDQRNGPSILVAALDVLDGTVTGQDRQHRRHRAFIPLLGAIERQLPADTAIPVVLDNDAGQKQATVRTWLARHPRRTFPSTPKSCSPPLPAGHLPFSDPSELSAPEPASSGRS